jgi:hypothetical protein
MLVFRLYIPLKNNFVVEMIRGVILWTVWLERNKLCFTDKKACSISVLGNKIISLAQYWCSKKGKVNLLQLSLVMPQEVGDLCMQVQEVPMWTKEGDTLAEDGMEEEDILGLEEATHRLEMILVGSSIPLMSGRGIDTLEMLYDLEIKIHAYIYLFNFLVIICILF